MGNGDLAITMIRRAIIQLQENFPNPQATSVDFA